ncbi:MAG: hypothetical protein BJ554DRAFT_8406, partial [Olpidium bornovanus]
EPDRKSSALSLLQEKTSARLLLYVRSLFRPCRKGHERGVRRALCLAARTENEPRRIFPVHRHTEVQRCVRDAKGSSKPSHQRLHRENKRTVGSSAVRDESEPRVETGKKEPKEYLYMDVANSVVLLAPGLG